MRVRTYLGRSERNLHHVELCSKQAFRWNSCFRATQSTQGTHKKTSHLHKNHICTWHAEYRLQGQGSYIMLSFANENKGTGRSYSGPLRGWKHMHAVHFPAGKAVLRRDHPETVHNAALPWTDHVLHAFLNLQVSF